jgi:hypothetical protein
MRYRDFTMLPPPDEGAMPVGRRGVAVIDGLAVATARVLTTEARAAFASRDAGRFEASVAALVDVIIAASTKRC